MFRVPLLRPHIEGSDHNPGHVYLSSARWECRAVDPSTNPYLAAAMFLGAGLDGIEQDLDPGDPQLVNMYELSDEELEKRGIRQLPRTLLEAVTAFEADDLGRRVMGDELYRSYIDLKKSEWWSYHNSISQWEIDEYLTKF
jgi:glutamine synthetase